jgi:hypothetical protein
MFGSVRWPPAAVRSAQNETVYAWSPVVNGAITVPRGFRSRLVELLGHRSAARQSRVRSPRRRRRSHPAGREVDECRRCVDEVSHLSVHALGSCAASNPAARRHPRRAGTQSRCLASPRCANATTVYVQPLEGFLCSFDGPQVLHLAPSHAFGMIIVPGYPTDRSVTQLALRIAQEVERYPLLLLAITPRRPSRVCSRRWWLRARPATRPHLPGMARNALGFQQPPWSRAALPLLFVETISGIGTRNTTLRRFSSSRSPPESAKTYPSSRSRANEDRNSRHPERARDGCNRRGRTRGDSRDRAQVAQDRRSRPDAVARRVRAWSRSRSSRRSLRTTSSASTHA